MQGGFVIPGKVYLIGAGPGNPNLLTDNAARLLRAADVVLHDGLVSPEILALVSARAAVHNVGKRVGLKNFTQDEIPARLIACARQGHLVLHLKAGDSRIFDRAHGEIAALREAGIAVEVVRGVAAAPEDLPAMLTPSEGEASNDVAEGG
jgi:uroporphyrin-III C-methyltransferase